MKPLPWEASRELGRHRSLRALSAEKRSDIAAAWCEGMACCGDYEAARKNVWRSLRGKYGSWVYLTAVLIQAAITILRFWWERRQADGRADILGQE